MIQIGSIEKKVALLVAFAAACLGFACFVAFSSATPAYADGADGQNLYRIYNPNSGEHFYTSDKTERSNLCGGKRAGWSYEGVGWVAPSDGAPVYRLYNANGGEHHYTTDESEKNNLVSLGWSYEGVGWVSAPSENSVPLYRDYNPNQFANNHNYTASREEHEHLISLGWKEEGIGWFAEAAPEPISYDNSAFAYVYPATGGAPDPVSLNTLVGGLTEPSDPSAIVDYIVPAAEVAPATNVASVLYKGKPEYWQLASGISENSASFWLETRNKSGLISIELDENGLIQPNAKANCYSFY